MDLKWLDSKYYLKSNIISAFVRTKSQSSFSCQISYQVIYNNYDSNSIQTQLLFLDSFPVYFINY